MPKKSRRIAVKQAELGQRKRRATKRPSDDEAPVPVAPTQAAVGVGSPGATPPRATSSDTSRRLPQERPTPAVAAPLAANPYIWSELKRIGSITGLVVAILVVLTVVLR
ncbi:MAG: hypothetical protein HY672_04310 [Chloroflexi bacterium]|nr:hypothetical protein [Chloroflexota bacterium]